MIATTSLAQQDLGPVCGLREEVIEGYRLQTQYKEVVIALGRFNDDSVLEIWGNVNSHTWTILRSSPDGREACGLMSGGDLKLLTEQA